MNRDSSDCQPDETPNNFLKWRAEFWNSSRRPSAAVTCCRPGAAAHVNFGFLEASKRISANKDIEVTRNSAKLNCEQAGPMAEQCPVSEDESTEILLIADPPESTFMSESDRVGQDSSSFTSEYNTGDGSPRAASTGMVDQESIDANDSMRNGQDETDLVTSISAGPLACIPIQPDDNYFNISPPMRCLESDGNHDHTSFDDMPELHNRIVALEHVIQIKMITVAVENNDVEWIVRMLNETLPYQNLAVTDHPHYEGHEAGGNQPLLGYPLDEWPEQTNDRCIAWLQTAASCTSMNCGDDDCIFWKEIIEDIDAYLTDGTVFNRALHMRILNLVSRHAAFCSEIMCGVPWCHFFSNCHHDEPNEQIAALRRSYSVVDLEEDPFMGLVEEGEMDGEDGEASTYFCQIDESVNWPSITFGYGSFPKVGLDYRLYAGSSAKHNRYTAIGLALTLPPMYLNLQQYTLLEGSDRMWQILHRENIRHDNIVRLLWCTYTSSSLITVCIDKDSVSDGRNLQKCLDNLYLQGNQLTWPVISRYMSGLVSAARFLHNRGVLFLQWTASSIYLSLDGTRAQLADFSCAVHEETVNEDEDLIEVVRDVLPPHVIPPEMFLGDIGAFSDVWGIGCLVQEFTTGLPLHYRMRHSSREELRNYVRNFNVDRYRNTLGNDFLRRIFTSSHDDRIGIDDVQQYFDNTAHG